MTVVARCTDCGWTFTDDDLETVGDALERHARKERHHVELTRHVVDVPV